MHSFSFPFLARPRWLVGTAVVIALLAGWSSAGAVPARLREMRGSMATRPSVSLSLPASANAGSAIGFTYAFHRVTVGDRLFVQRQEGTARVWRTISQLRSPAGSASIDGLPLGIYRLRVAAQSGSGHIVAQEQQTIMVFGRVPFSTLMSGLKVFNDGLNGTYAMPTETFDYVIGFPLSNNGDPPFPIPPVSATNNYCRELHLNFVPGRADTAADFPPWSASVSIVQATLEPVSASASAETIGSLNAPLVPGTSWSINVAQTTGMLNGDDAMFVNGYGVCDRSASLWPSSKG